MLFMILSYHISTAIFQWTTISNTYYKSISNLLQVYHLYQTQIYIPFKPNGVQGSWHWQFINLCLERLIPQKEMAQFSSKQQQSRLPQKEMAQSLCRSHSRLGNTYSLMTFSLRIDDKVRSQRFPSKSRAATWTGVKIAGVSVWLPPLSLSFVLCGGKRGSKDKCNKGWGIRTGEWMKGKIKIRRRNGKGAPDLFLGSALEHRKWKTRFEWMNFGCWCPNTQK